MLLGELIAENGQLPDEWTPGNMSMVQLSWLSYWRAKKERRQVRSLGELLGVIWSADTYKKSPASKLGRRVKEAFIPLAAIINGEALYKTLDKILDTNGNTTSHNPNMQDLGSALSMQAYQKLFQDNQEKPADGKPLIPGHPLLAKKVPGPTPVPHVQPAAPATPSKAVVNLEQLREMDPELARHMDPDAAW